MRRCLIVSQKRPYIGDDRKRADPAPDRKAPVTTSGLQNTAYLLLMALIVYVWVVGG